MEHTLEIAAVAHGGDGIGRIDGQVCFVPFALPGDVVRVKIARKARQVLWGEIIEVLQPSPDRLPDPACPNFGRCGVCTWIHFAYPAQGDWKRRLVQDALRRMGGIDIEVGWREDPALRMGYRTRAEFHSGPGSFGFFARGTHDVVDTKFCPLCHARVNEALETLRGLAPRGPLTVTVNPEGPETLVWTKSAWRALKNTFPLAGSPADQDPPAQFLFDRRPIVNGAFSQASLLLNRMLLDCTSHAIGSPGSLLDLYAGNGNFSLDFCARAEVTGIDHHRQAIQAARAASGGDYREGGESAMSAAATQRAWDVILLDPPRTGAKALMPALLKARAARIVYVSCDAPTLARDLRMLAGGGWRVEEVTALDMFPNTAHVETVAALVRP